MPLQVHPHSAPSTGTGHVSIDHKYSCSTSSSVFTVWKKSLVLNGKGFTVFDSLGNLVFRVDNYGSNPKNEVLLMDDVGEVVITILRRKRWSVGQTWEAWRSGSSEPTGTGHVLPIFSVKKKPSWHFSNKTKTRCNVFVNGLSQQINHHNHQDYHIQAGFGSLCCTIFSTSSGDIIAQVKRKQAAKSDIMLGDDVFSLVVQPGVDQAFVMALLIMFNQIS